MVLKMGERAELVLKQEKQVKAVGMWSYDTDDGCDDCVIAVP